MNSHVGRRLLLAAAVLGALAVVALGLFVALGVRSVVADPNPDCDRDGDGVLDVVDNCPNNWNPAPQDDSDGDTVGDACDNCLDHANAGQADSETPPGIESYWKFDEGVGLNASDSKGSNTGTLEGAEWVEPGQGQVDDALWFNEGGDTVRVPDHASLDVGTGDFSIEAWVRGDDFSGTNAFIDKRGWAPSERGYSLYIWQGRLGLRLADAGGGTNYSVPIEMAIDPGCPWHFVAVAVDRDGADDTASFWVNGVNHSAEVGHQGDLDNDGDFLIGGHQYDPSFGFDGGIDEVAFYKRLLTQAEIDQHYQNGLTGHGYPGDGIGDVCDNCWYVYNQGQDDFDGDCLGPPYDDDPLCGDACTCGACSTGVDADGDAFNDDIECYLPTDSCDACPDWVGTSGCPGPTCDGDDAWPLDNDVDRTISVTGDVFHYVGRVGAVGGPPDTPECDGPLSGNWLQRLDLDRSCDISVTGDIYMYIGRIGQTCG